MRAVETEPFTTDQHLFRERNLQDIWGRIATALQRQADAFEGDEEDVEPMIYWWDGADSAKLERLESLIGRPLPADFRDSYLIHDGSDMCIYPGGSHLSSTEELLSLNSIISKVEGWVKSLEGQETIVWNLDHLVVPDGPVHRVNWSRGWVPIVGEGTGDYLCLDLNPPEGGTAGQVFYFAHEYGATRVVLPSFRALMERCARDLETRAIDYDPDDIPSWRYIEAVAEHRDENPGDYDYFPA